MQALRFLFFIILVALAGSDCISHKAWEQEEKCACDTPAVRFPVLSDSVLYERGNLVAKGALLSTQYASLEELKEVVQIEYADTSGSGERLKQPGVLITQCSPAGGVVSVLTTGVSEGDFNKAQKGDFWDRLNLAVSSPYTVANRKNLVKSLVLARRKYLIFGEGDVAFYDLALQMVKRIDKQDLKQWSPKHTTEKGFINTFNHVTAQALLTSLFSEQFADFIGDAHERHHMPELITGHFKPSQLSDPVNNPVDNYVDLLNNEWGQELGKQLKRKYNINWDTQWTPELLTSYLNEMLQYYSWNFQIGFQPFKSTDKVVVRFTNKMNTVLTSDSSVLN